MPSKDGKGIGLWEATAMGVGGMVGGGIFAVLGLSVALAKGGTPAAFAIAGVVALLTASSYSRLSVCYPDRGGTVIYLDKAFGSGYFMGSANVLLWLSYVVMLALYAYAFGSYGAALLPWKGAWARHALISLAIIGPALLNVLSAKIIGRTEIYVVVLKVAILLFFLATCAKGIDPARLALSTWVSPLPLIAGGMIIFVAYEGFELIANTSDDIRDPRRNLPRAFHISVVFVIALYVAIALVTVGSLDLKAIAQARDYALAEAALPFLGKAGFTLIAAAALLSTFSAINATLYGSSRLTYTIAKEGELPEALERQVWGEPIEGLVVTSILALALANLADLSAISTLGSAGFLVIFALVNAANLRLAKETGATGANRLLAGLGALACVAAFGAMAWQSLSDNPAQGWVLAALFGGALALEGAYRLTRCKGPRKRTAR